MASEDKKDGSKVSLQDLVAQKKQEKNGTKPKSNKKVDLKELVEDNIEIVSGEEQGKEDLVFQSPRGPNEKVRCVLLNEPVRMISGTEYPATYQECRPNSAGQYKLPANATPFYRKRLLALVTFAIKRSLSVIGNDKFGCLPKELTDMPTEADLLATSPEDIGKLLVANKTLAQQNDKLMEELAQYKK